MNGQPDESFAVPGDFEDIDDFDSMWREVLVALDEIDIRTLDRAVARETFDALVDGKRGVRFRISPNPGGGMAGFKTMFTYVFPCKHLSCNCSCSH
jgi:hypothetical protein